jgi:hypothetical protein
MSDEQETVRRIQQLLRKKYQIDEIAFGEVMNQRLKMSVEEQQT